MRRYPTGSEVLEVRAFLAIELNAAVQDALTGLLRRLHQTTARVTWVKPANVHLTLRFLGDIDETQRSLLEARCASICAAFAPFTITVHGIGAFPNTRRPRVVWAGVEARDDTLVSLQREAESAARAVGLAPDTKRFSPHITLGRVRDEGSSGNLHALLEADRTFHAGDIQVTTVALFQSTLSPQGSIYTRLCEFPLTWTSPG